jgi:hypothetical protein
MNKVNITKFWSLVLLGAVVSLSSCLKDKGYEDGEYGTITGRTTGNKFISIPRAANKPNIVGVEAKAGFQDINLFSFSYDYEKPAETAISVTVAVNNALVTSLNQGLELLPAAAYQIVNLTTAFKVGQVISDPFVIKLNTNSLDPTKKYGLGFSITTVTDGVKQSTNLNDVVFAFTIKNKYDGIYAFRARHDHPADRSAAWNRGTYAYPYDIYLETTGANSVKMYNDAFGAGFHPLVTTGVSGYGGTELNIEFDGTDKISRVFNTPGASATRDFILNPAITDSRYATASKTVFAAILLTQTGFINTPIYDTMVFVKARP